MSERIIFRKWRDTGDVIAFFPDTYGPPDCNAGMMLSYMHVGQHSEADYFGCVPRTRPATPDEYGGLLRELQSIGGDDFAVVKRFTRKKGD